MTAENLKSQLEYQKEWASQCTKSCVQHSASQHEHRCTVAGSADQPAAARVSPRIAATSTARTNPACTGSTQTLSRISQVRGRSRITVLLALDRHYSDNLPSYLRISFEVSCIQNIPQQWTAQQTLLKYYFLLLGLCYLTISQNTSHSLYSEKSLIIFLYEVSLWHCWLDVSLLNLKHLFFWREHSFKCSRKGQTKHFHFFFFFPASLMLQKYG